MATATKLGRVVTYLKGIPTTELLGPLVTCSFEMTWQTKTIVCQLSVSMTHKVKQPFGHVVFQYLVTN